MSVGYKLYRQIRDFAPQDWTSGELVTALMIADSANESTRRAYITADELNRLCRMSGRGVRKNLEKLAEKGYEFRVAQAKNGDGKAVYAVAGNGVEYQVPDVFMLLGRGAQVAYGLVDKLADEGLSTGPRRNHSTG